ncbi:MAG: FAD-dependent oxidoreductase [Rhodobacteraceae bacterium]|nr:FAD-dependent oxidoreductase [Paracoccaceae bacterium]
MRRPPIFWDVDLPEPAYASGEPLPKRVDVAIVGGGFTGLSAALTLARAGRSVVVFDAGRIGAGASSRNGGMVGPSFHKLGSAGLLARYGEAKTLALMREGLLALDHFEALIADEGLDCDLQMRGRFRGARTIADRDAMARECDWLRTNLGLQSDMVAHEDQRAEIGSDFYQGGVVYHRDGGVHPRKLVLELARIAAEAGATLIPDCPVTAMRRDGGEVELSTPKGALRAGEVVIATNAYADRRTSVMAQRVVPIDTFVVATEDLSPNQMADLTPRGRMFGESGRIFMWFRPTPDGRRFIFGGRLGPPGAGPEARKQVFARSVRRVFPQLDGIRFDHSWSGRIAYTPDHSPHLGKVDGVWLAGGYCGSGVTRSVYLGSKLARRILGLPGADTALDDLPFDKVPFSPFSRQGAALLTRWYAFQDARDLRRAARKQA